MEDFDLVGNKGKNKISEWGVWKWFKYIFIFIKFIIFN